MHIIVGRLARYLGYKPPQPALQSRLRGDDTVEILDLLLDGQPKA